MKPAHLCMLGQVAPVYATQHLKVLDLLIQANAAQPLKLSISGHQPYGYRMVISLQTSRAHTLF